MRKTDLLILVLYADGGRPVAGMTRLVKLLFLAQMEALSGGGPRPALRDAPFDFVAHRFGPFALDIYDEVEFLKSVGMAEDGGSGTFCITGKGRRFVEQRLLRKVPARQVERIEKIKERHCGGSLDDLLHYVYTTYPAYTVRSEILDRVLRRQ